MVLSFTEAAAQAVQGAACSLLALSDEATRWINSAIGANGDFGNVAGALRKNVCNESSPDTTGVGPNLPFTGGQCPGVLYRVEAVGQLGWGRCPGATASSSNRDFTKDSDQFGPIRGVFLREKQAGQCGPIVFDYVIECSDGNGNEIEVVSQATSGVGRSDLFQKINNFSVTVTRVDGQPDTCGNPQGEPVGDYNDFSTTVSITYEDNSNTEITEDIDITLGPLIVGIGGILYAPVTVGTGDITLNGTVELAPNFSVELFPNGLFGGGGNTDTPAPSPGVDDPEPTVPDERRRIIGAIVTVTNFDEDVARVTQVAQGESPDIFVPRTGNVSFYIDTPGGQAWTEPTPLRNVRQYVPCPAREGAVDVAVTAGTGFTLDVTPVYADLAVI